MSQNFKSKRLHRTSVSFSFHVTNHAHVAPFRLKRKCGSNPFATSAIKPTVMGAGTEDVQLWSALAEVTVHLNVNYNRESDQQNMSW